MRMDMLKLAALLGVALVSNGCGEGSVEAPASSGAQQVTAESPQQSIKQTVSTFLDAVRRGDTNAASAQLTPLALKKISENNLTISPPASESAKFTIGAVELIDDDKAVVDSVWTDFDVDGEAYDQNTTWALRSSEAGWRISGMAEDMGPDQPPMVLDFENPAAFGQGPATSTAASPKTSPTRQANQTSDDPFQQGVNR